jgi:hypothetical protein
MLFWVVFFIVIILGLSVLGASFLALIPSQSQTSNLQASVEVIRTFIETVAIIVAGLWTYERFIKTKKETREDYPYPKIMHRIEDHDLGGGNVYLSVFVTVTNEGKTRLSLDTAKIHVRQVIPLTEGMMKLINEAIRKDGEKAVQDGDVTNKLFIDSGQRLGWNTLGNRAGNQLRETFKELEPGQTREIQFDFLLLSNEAKIVEVISYFNHKESSWELTTLYPLSSGKIRRKATH